MNQILKFYADWCGPCKQISPIVEEVKKEYPQIEFISVNVDESPELAQEHGIRGIPQVIFLKEGKEVTRLTGVFTKPTLISKIKQVY